MKARMVNGMMSAVSTRLVCLLLSLCVLSIEPMKIKQKHLINTPFIANQQFVPQLAQQPFQFQQQLQQLPQQIQGQLMGRPNTAGPQIIQQTNANVQPFSFSQIGQAQQMNQQQPQQQQSSIQSTALPKNLMLINNGKAIPATIYMGNLAFKPQQQVNTYQATPQAVPQTIPQAVPQIIPQPQPLPNIQSSKFNNAIMQQPKVLQPQMPQDVSRNFISTQQKAKFDFGDLAKDVIGGLQDAARGANGAIDEAEQQAEEERKKWDADVCTQFCTEVDGFEGQGIVRDECPDNCFEEHPEWKKQSSIDLDVKGAADSAKKQLCLNPDGTNIPDCTPQISQTSDPSRQLQTDQSQVGQLVANNNAQQSLVKMQTANQAQSSTESQLQVPVIIIKEWITAAPPQQQQVAAQTTQQQQQFVQKRAVQQQGNRATTSQSTLNQAQLTNMAPSNFIQVQKRQPQMFPQANRIQQMNVVPNQIQNINQAIMQNGFAREPMQVNGQLQPMPTLNQNKPVSQIQNFLQMNNGNQQAQNQLQIQATSPVDQQQLTITIPSQQQFKTQLGQTQIQKPFQPQMNLEQQLQQTQMTNEQNQEHASNVKIEQTSQQSTVTPVGQVVNSAQQSAAPSGAFNCKEWLKKQPIEVQREIEQKTQQQIQMQIQAFQQQKQSQPQSTTQSQTNQFVQVPSLPSETTNQLKTMPNGNQQSQSDDLVEIEQLQTGDETDTEIELEQLSEQKEKKVHALMNSHKQSMVQNESQANKSNKNSNSVNSQQLAQLNKMFSRHQQKSNMLSNIDEIDKVDQFDVLNSLK